MVANSISTKIIDKIVDLCNLPHGLLDGVSVNITPGRYNFYHTADTERRLAAHQYLDELAFRTAGLRICYKRQQFDAIPILESVYVGNAKALCESLCISVLSVEVSEAIDRFDQAVAGAPPWLKKEFSDTESLWRKGKSIHRFKHTNIDQVLLAVRFATWLDENTTDLDYRTASVLALGDSKLLEKNIGAIGRVISLGPKFDIDNDITAEEILAFSGVTPNSPLVRVSGATAISINGAVINLSKISPYLAFPADTVDRLRINSDARYILLIENLSTFERYTRKFDDGGVIFYTNGFPSKKLVQIINSTLVSTYENLPVYHWGDIDVGGYRILAMLSDRLTTDLIPYQMIGNFPGHSDKEVDLKVMKDVIRESRSDPIQSLARKIETMIECGQKQYWVEQEALDLISPISTLK